MIRIGPRTEDLIPREEKKGGSLIFVRKGNQFEFFIGWAWVLAAVVITALFL